MARRLPISPAAVRRLLTEVESSGRGEHVLAVGGASEFALVLRRQFFRGGADPAAVLVGGPQGADVYVHVLKGELTAGDEVALRRARCARVPVVAVAVGPLEGDRAIPYVLATDVVRVEAGESFPLETIARVIARRVGEDGAPLAARVPLLRVAVCDVLVESFARKNGLLAASVSLPGADLPVLTLNELRLVLRLAQAHGEADVRERVPELAATVGAGFGLRALARELFDLVPVAGWAVRGAVAYAGTRVVGEAALRWFERVSTRLPAAAGRAWP